MESPNRSTYPLPSQNSAREPFYCTRACQHVCTQIARRTKSGTSKRADPHTHTHNLIELKTKSIFSIVNHYVLWGRGMLQSEASSRTKGYEAEIDSYVTSSEFRASDGDDISSCSRDLMSLTTCAFWALTWTFVGHWWRRDRHFRRQRCSSWRMLINVRIRLRS